MLSGDEEIRTLDPLLARQVLSQLSYGPKLILVDVVLNSLSLTQPTKLCSACNHHINLLNSAVHLCKDLLTLQCGELQRLPRIPQIIS